MQQQAEQDGKKDVPSDLFEFNERADVIFLDKNNNQVEFVRCIVAWEAK